MLVDAHRRALRPRALALERREARRSRTRPRRLIGELGVRDCGLAEERGKRLFFIARRVFKPRPRAPRVETTRVSTRLTKKLATEATRERSFLRAASRSSPLR